MSMFDPNAGDSGIDDQNRKQAEAMKMVEALRSAGLAAGGGQQTGLVGSGPSAQYVGGDPLAAASGGFANGMSMVGRMTPGVTDGGYSVGQGNAYAGTTNAAGMFTPNRRGM